MYRFILPTILVGVSVAGFLMFTKPLYDETFTTMKSEIASYDQALSNSKALENERDKLTTKYNSIDLNNLSRLQKFLPDSVDNIRLILEIEKIALPYGMILKDVKYDATQKPNSSTGTQTATTVANPLTKEDNKGYGEWNLEFSTEGSYSNFISFIGDLENNLRIVDISSISFSSNTDSGIGVAKKQPADYYKYDFKIKTYWLKN